MKKDFNKWNERKKALERRPDIFCNTRELWWCSIGANVGAEASGKNDLFERPVIILKVYNVQSILVAPLTSQPKNDKYHTKIRYEDKDGWVVLSHARTISPRRLQRKMCRIGKKQFHQVMEDWFFLLHNKSAPRLSSGRLGARRPDTGRLPKSGHKSSEDIHNNKKEKAPDGDKTP